MLWITCDAFNGKNKVGCVMALIYTSKGMLEEESLTRSDGDLDNENEYTTWQEWRLGDEVVKRNVQVRLKKAAVFADGTAGIF